MTRCFQSCKRICGHTAHTLRQDHGCQHMFRFLRTKIKLLRTIRCNRGITLRNLKNMVPDSQLLHFLRCQDIVILLHKVRNRLNPRSGKNLLLRPVQANLRTEQEQINRFSVGIIGRQINIRQSGASGERIRFDLGQRIRDFQCHETRAVPERLRFHAADTLRNLEPLAAVRSAKGTVRNHGVIFQRITAFNRTGKPLGNLMRKDFFCTVIFAAVHGCKRNRLVKSCRIGYSRLNRFKTDSLLHCRSRSCKFIRRLRSFGMHSLY